MATADEHAQVVLSAIVPTRRDLLEKALRQLTPDHFPERVQRKIFEFLERYAEHTSGEVMPAQYLDDHLRGRADPGQLTLYTETYTSYAAREVPDGEFAWSVQQLREIAAEKATGEVITSGMEVLRNGKTLDNGETLRGHEDARIHMLEQFQLIDRDLTMADAPEGDLRDERNEMLADYQERKRAHVEGTAGGILFGITELDAKVGGMQPGELVLAAGYSSDGKTTLCTQTAWSAAIEQGKNVVFLTTETLRTQVRRKLISRHSMLPQFNLANGLNTRDLKAGTLSEDEERAMHRVVDDMAKNPAYGRLYVAQVPRASTIGTIDQRLHRINRKMNIDFVVFDYLALASPTRRRSSQREELSDIMKEAKLLAVNFDDSRGVPFMSPWQVGRQHREEAERVGFYTSRALSETAEATNSADIIISLLAPTDNTNRRADVTMQLLKARDGETANGLITEVDYATSQFVSKQVGFADFGAVSRARGASPADAFDLDSLI